MVLLPDGSEITHNLYEKRKAEAPKEQVTLSVFPDFEEQFIPKLKEKTEELAVMIDPFRPLMLTQDAVDIEDESYHTSWQIAFSAPVTMPAPRWFDTAMAGRTARS